MRKKCTITLTEKPGGVDIEVDWHGISRDHNDTSATPVEMTAAIMLSAVSKIWTTTEAESGQTIEEILAGGTDA